ncbi:redox-regulated ATPase YchF [soil metagenome]
MRAGLAGFSGSGKSTLFELLSGDKSDPGKVHSGQLGMAELNDSRLDFLADLHRPKKITKARLELLDTPGLMPGSHGDNPQRLALIRNGEALLVVLGAFAGQDPVADLLAFRDELTFADLSVITKRIETLEANIKKPRPDREEMIQELELLRRVLAALEAGQTVASLGLTEEEKKPMRSFGLLTEKAQVVVLNAPQGEAIPEAIRQANPDTLAIDAQMELELQQMEPEERVAFMQELGITELGRDRIIRAAYDAVGIITFFTAGDPEVRGWNVEQGASAVEAAGKIHTDLARGFIRAEVTAFDDLKRVGSVKEAKAQNLQRLEGKDYIVKDGDVMYFRSNA